MDEKFTFFWGGPFSQWWDSPFTADGVKYSCAEQYMMAGKATMFEDYETLAAIMKTGSPREQKALGRQVKNFDDEQWRMHARDVVFRGNILKFSQDTELKNILLETVGTTLVEASPHDKLWGIGLGEDDPLAHNRATWQGENWLGEVLNKVRSSLEYWS